MAVLALRQEDPLEHQAPGPSRGEVLERYRRLREISKLHHANAMNSMSTDAILHQARQLG